MEKLNIKGKEMKNKEFNALLSSSSISAIGDGIRTLLVPLIILYITGSSFIFGLIVSIEFLVWIVSTGFTGYVIDKTNRVSNLVYSNLIMAIIMGCVSLSYFIANSYFIYFLIMAIIGVSIGESFFNPASFSLLPDIVHENLDKHNALLSMSVNASLIGGYLIAGFGFHIVLWGYLFGIDAISFLISSVIIYLGLKGYAKFEKVKKIHLLRDTKDAWSFIKNERLILYTIIFGVFFNLTLSGFIVVIPTIAVKYTSSSSFSLSFFYIAELIGMIVGGSLILGKKRKSKLLNYLAIGSIGEGCVMLFTSLTLLSPTGVLILFMVTLLFLKGLFSETINIPYSVWYQKLVPRNVRAKVNNFKDLILTLPTVIGLPLMGYLLDCYSNWLILFIFGFFAIMTSIIEYLILSKVFKENSYSSVM